MYPKRIGSAPAAPKVVSPPFSNVTIESLEDRQHLSASVPPIAMAHGLVPRPVAAKVAPLQHASRAKPNKVRATVGAATPAVGGPTTPADFFPIGVWYQPAYKMGQWKAAGVNTLVGYESEGGAFPLALWDSYAAGNGLYEIRQAQKHPARDNSNPNLLGWLLGDEPDLHGTKSTTLASQYSSLKAANPDKPVFVNFDGSRVLGWQGNMSSKGYKAYLASADWVGSDVYPVTGWNLPNALTAPGDAAYRLSAYSEGKPQFAFIETSDQELPWLPQSVPGATPDQVRAEIWNAINRGVKGIVYFPQRIGYGFAYDSTPPKVLAEMTKQDAIIAGIGGALASPLNPPGMSVTVAKPLERSFRSYNGKNYFIVTNTSNAALDASVRLGGDKVVSSGTGSVEVYSEGRSVATVDGGFTDHFGKYETHIYIAE